MTDVVSRDLYSYENEHEIGPLLDRLFRRPRSTSSIMFQHYTLSFTGAASLFLIVEDNKSHGAQAPKTTYISVHF